MLERGGIPQDSPEFQDDMVFRLNPLDFQEGQKDDDPMWYPASSSPLDWFMEDE